MPKKSNPLKVPICTSTNRPDEITCVLDCVDSIDDVRYILGGFYQIFVDMLNERTRPTKAINGSREDYWESMEIILCRLFEGMTAQLAGISAALMNILQASKNPPIDTP